MATALSTPPKRFPDPDPDPIPDLPPLDPDWERWLLVARGV
eukprot:CAMPEP_0175053900 /NCGR_PEP_ID=MMETSP0052_2-20121109/9192_1 /TAXON_ID=51329 ORGANISM="Polytomella parva, Strain SAG 63-3" /NCGR_SAMPLE_ID=MMETSP0052_2 /ASSEMBLY_ACC=CAM_ASM_000194 /LENGTH=40 /DNA_ID= /DNA_START= /DNA_END= /DNA_ORIENTATION=